MDCVVHGELPNDAASLRSGVAHGRQGNPFLSQPQMNLPNALKFGKFEEDQCNPFTHPAIGIDDDAVMALLHIADSHGEEELAAACLLLQGLE